MKACYLIKDGLLSESEPDLANVRVITQPTDEEKKEIIEQILPDSHTLESILDPEEGARVEIEEDYVVIIWKRPKNVSVVEQLQFGIASAGIVVRSGRITIICSEPDITIRGKEFRGVRSPGDLIVRILLYSVHHYQGHLRVMKMVTADLQAKLNRSMENHYFLQMFALSESLVFYLDALESNSTLFQKLSRNTQRLGFGEAEVELLEDLIIEQNQCARQAEIHSQVLAGLMDARGNIINNNMNVLLKNLTLINVVFLPLNLLASIGGMSEYTTMMGFVNPWIAYALFFVLMAIVGMVTWVILERWMEFSRSAKQKPGMR